MPIAQKPNKLLTICSQSVQEIKRSSWTAAKQGTSYDDAINQFQTLVLIPKRNQYIYTATAPALRHVDPIQDLEFRYLVLKHVDTGTSELSVFF